MGIGWDSFRVGSLAWWVCRIGLGWYVYEVKCDEVWAENSVHSVDREVDMSVGAACLVHQSHGTLVI